MGGGSSPSEIVRMPHSRARRVRPWWTHGRLLEMQQTVIEMYSRRVGAGSRPSLPFGPGPEMLQLAWGWQLHGCPGEYGASGLPAFSHETVRVRPRAGAWVYSSRPGDHSLLPVCLGSTSYRSK